MKVPTVGLNPFSLRNGVLEITAVPTPSELKPLLNNYAYMSGVIIPSCDGGSFARTSIPIPENWSLEDQV